MDNLVRTVNEVERPKELVKRPTKLVEEPVIEEQKLHPFEETVTVPSLGKFYEGKVPGGKVKIRPMEVSEEKLMYSYRDKVVAINKVLERCVLTKTMPLQEYLLTDRFFLFLNIMIISYGSEQKYNTACPSCENSFQYSVVLPQGLTLKIASDDDIEPFPIFLPMSKKTILVRFLRGYDEEAILSYVKQNKIIDGGDPAYSYSLARSIVAVEGKEIDEVEKLNFCEHLHARDSAMLRKTVEQNSTGIDLNVEVTCPVCQNKFRSGVEFSTEFFRSGS